MSSLAVECAFASCRRRVFSASRRCASHQPELLVSPPRKPVNATVPDTGYTRTRTSSGFVRDEWRVGGELHRIGAPAVFEYRPGGAIEAEKWFFDGRLHRVGGPAATSFRVEGTVQREEWVRHRMIHRIDGPATVNYNRWGSQESGEWCVDGTRVDGPAGAAEIIETWSDEQILEEIIGSAYAPALDAPDVDLRALAPALAAGMTKPSSVIEVLRGAPAEWVLAYEEGSV